MRQKIETKRTNDSGKDSASFYDRFLGPLFFEPYAIEITERIKPGDNETVLELAAGTGRVTRHLRKRLPRAKLIASDLSEPMLAEAKKNLNQQKIDWQIIDGQQIPFPDHSIDLIVCCFGYMFMSDKAKAFREANRVLKPGGTLLFSTWDKLEFNEFSFVSRKLAERYMLTPLPDSFDLAVSMSEVDDIKNLLKDAGFKDVQVEKVKKFSVYASAKEAATGQVEGGAVFASIREHQPQKIEMIKRELEKELSEKFGVAPMIAPLSALITRASKAK